MEHSTHPDRRRSSPATRCASWPPPRCSGPASSARSTRTSAPSASAARTSACPTGTWKPWSTRTTWAWPCAWSSTAPGASRPAVDLTTAGGGACRRGGGRRGPGRGRDEHRAHRAGRRARLRRRRRWVSAYEIDPLNVAVADKLAWLGDWSARLLGRPAVDHVDALADAGPGEQVLRRPAGTTATQQRVRLHPALTAVAVDPAARFETMRTLAPPAGRGWEYLTGTGWDFDDELAAAARAAGREAGRPGGRGRPLRPGDPPDQPVADHPRVDRPRHRAGPGARLRGGLRGHVVRDPGQAGPPAVRLPGDAGHRGPHRRRTGWPPSATTTRAWRASSPGTSSRRRAGRLPARPADRPAHRARPVQRLRLRRLPRRTCRSSGWPTSPCSRPRTGPAPRS